MFPESIRYVGAAVAGRPEPKSNWESRRRKYEEVLYELLTQAALALTWLDVLARLRELPESHPLHRMLEVHGGKVRLVDDPESALMLVMDALNPDEDENLRTRLTTIVSQSCAARDLPAPRVEVRKQDDSVHWFG